MSGASSFNEVFLSDVRIGDDMRVGAVGDGWKVANATLGFERTASGQGTRRKGGSFDDLLALARRLGKAGDPVVRQQLADVYVRTQLRSRDHRPGGPRRRGRGRRPGRPRRSASSSLRRTSPASARWRPSCSARRIAADTGEPDTFAWTEHLLGAPGYRLAGGTDEIQRNIIGERVLGLPREPRVDRGVPYSKLPRSG